MGVRQSARIAFPDSCVGRTEKQGGEGENKRPQAPCTAPNQSARLKKKHITSLFTLPIIWEPAPKFNPGCSRCPSTQTCPNISFCRHPDPNRYMLLYPYQTPRASTYTSLLLLHTSPCNIFPPLFSLPPRDANAQRPCMLAVVRCLQFCRLEDRPLPAVLRTQCCRAGGGKGGGHAGARRRGGERREEGVLRGLAGASPTRHRVHSPGDCAAGAILTHEMLYF